MYKIEVSQPIPIPGSTPPKTEVATYTYAHGWHHLQFLLREPSKEEILSIRRGPCEFALVIFPSVLFLLHRFEPSFDWSGASYVWSKQYAYDNTVGVPGEDDGSRAIVEVVLVDMETAEVKAIRAVTWSRAFTAAVHKAIREQSIERYKGREAVDRQINDIYLRHSSADMLAMAVARCRGGE